MANDIRIKSRIYRHRLQWLGHVILIKDSRVHKQILYAELPYDT